MSSTMLSPLEINGWSETTWSGLAAQISGHAPRPLILVDGAAGSGKTTLASRLVDILEGNLVHTDDVSWCADPIHWDEEMLDGIIRPWMGGTNVSYRPKGWIKENRPGSIEVDSGKALIIEGMGACRKTMRSVATYSIWVDTDPQIARMRVVQRDLANGENGGTVESVTKFADWWDSLLKPLFLEEEPWNYVDVIVSGMQSDLSQGKLMVHIPDGTITHPIGNCEGLHGIHL